MRSLRLQVRVASATAPRIGQAEVLGVWVAADAAPDVHLRWSVRFVRRHLELARRQRLVYELHALKLRRLRLQVAGRPTGP